MKNNALRVCAICLGLCLLLGVLFYFVAGDSLHFTRGSTPAVSSSAAMGELLANDTLKQAFVCDFDTLESIGFLVGTMARDNTDTLRVTLSDEKGTVLREQTVSTADFVDNTEYTVRFHEPLNDAKERVFILTITSLEGTRGNAVAFYYGNSVSTGRVDIPVELDETDALYVNGERMTDQNGKIFSLCLSVTGKNHHWFGAYYWYFFGGAAILLVLVMWRILYCYKHEKKNAILAVVLSLKKYSFLIRQLVARDFKTKYKRSVLGVLWSFLNPLLTMSIQYVVFSTIFKSSIPNFAIYLLSGIICFNFFNEATGMCLMSIVGNATLINKVYVPKYIYPFSRTLSSGINLLLSLLPLLLMLIVTGTPFTIAILLLPFVLLMLFMLSYGVGLILATMMVFFRDTQFLWGIFSMLLMYLTPVFYPETIIPESFMPIYKLNPLYHVLRFMRSILIDGVSLEPKAYLYCILLCALPLVIGILIFRKNQNKFIFNI